MSLVKLSLLLCSSISCHMGLARTPPHDAEDEVMVMTMRERIWQHLGVPCDIFLKTVIWQLTLAESTVILNALLDTPPSCASALAALGPASASRLTGSFLLGAALVTLGGALRAQSFRALGPFYTFVQCLRKEHRLVTRGPYALLRHPGYAGLLYCFVGYAVMYGAPGSWLRASGVLRYAWSRALVGCSAVITVASCVTLFCRSADEDRYLSQRFGGEWESWAKRVRYRLVPFVY